MDIKTDIQACLKARGWTPAVLARAAGVKSVQAITRILSGERQGMHSKNLLKLHPFLYPAHTLTTTDILATTHAPHAGRGRP